MSDKLITYEQAQFTDEQRKLITDVLCRGANPIEIDFYLNVAERLKLDPFKRQIHAMKRKVDGKDSMQFMVSIEGLRSIASRCKTSEGRDAYAGNGKPIFSYDEKGGLYSAEVTVYRIVQGEPRAFTAEVFYDECVQTKGIWENQRKVGEEPNSFWVKRPKGQLGKCAEAAALRKAFPEETGGVYVEEEIPLEDQDQRRPEHTTKQTAPKPEAEGMLPVSEATVLPPDSKPTARHWSDLLIEDAYKMVRMGEGLPYSGKAIWEITKDKDAYAEVFEEIPRDPDTVERHAIDCAYFVGVRKRLKGLGYDLETAEKTLRAEGFLAAEEELMKLPGNRLRLLSAHIAEWKSIK